MKDSNELFELCKQVYEVTGWESPQMFAAAYDAVAKAGYYSRQSAGEPLPPLYTSDYLLEKLPKNSDEGYPLTMSCIEEWRFYYWGDVIIEGKSDTPLKALLKLTIALDDAGELSKEDVKDE